MGFASMKRGLKALYSVAVSEFTAVSLNEKRIESSLSLIQAGRTDPFASMKRGLKVRFELISHSSRPPLASMKRGLKVIELSFSRKSSGERLNEKRIESPVLHLSIRDLFHAPQWKEDWKHEIQLLSCVYFVWPQWKEDWKYVSGKVAVVIFIHKPQWKEDWKVNLHLAPASSNSLPQWKEDWKYSQSKGVCSYIFWASMKRGLKACIAISSLIICLKPQWKEDWKWLFPFR